jgi:hypothetical protein
MKKIIALLLLCSAFFSSFAQTVSNDKDHDKVKKTSNVGQKIHNTFSKHKHYNGYKVKHKSDVNGHEVKTKKKVKTDE